MAEGRSTGGVALSSGVLIPGPRPWEGIQEFGRGNWFGPVLGSTDARGVTGALLDHAHDLFCDIKMREGVPPVGQEGCRASFSTSCTVGKGAERRKGFGELVPIDGPYHR